MDYYSISALINALISLGLGVFVLRRNYEASMNRNLFFLCFAAFFWSIYYFIWQIETDGDNALLWTRLLMLGAIWVPVAFFKVVISFLEIEKKQRGVHYFNIIIGILFSFLLFTPLMVSHVEPVSDFNYWPRPGVAYHFFVAWFSGMSLYGAFLAWQALSWNISSVKKLQIKYMLFGIALSIFCGSTNYFLWYDIPIKPYGNILASSYVVFSIYAIIRYRLLGIRVIFSRIYVFTLIGAFSYLSFHLVAWISNTFLGGIYTSRALIFGGLFALTYAIVFLPFLNKVQSWSDYLFYRGYNPQSILKDLALKLSSMIKLEQILSVIDKEFEKVLEVEDVSLVLFEYDKKKKLKSCTPVLGRLKRRKKTDHKNCVHGAISKGEIIYVDELDHKSEIYKFLKKIRIEVVAPLKVHSRVIGAIFMGEKISQNAYNKEDFTFLELISSQVAVAIENARLYKNVADFNRNLKRKVNSQTKDIREQSERLQKLLAMRSEFLDITSHQLRTPVSVIKGVLSMLEEGSVPKSKVKEFMSMAFNKSLKLEEIVDEILRASEMDSEKFELTLVPVDVEPIVREIYMERRSVAAKKNLELVLETPKKELGKVLSDQKYLKHVIINLVNNSLQYTLEGKVIIRLKQLRGKVYIEVEDTGIGIPKKDVPKLYKKFSRAQNAKDTFTDGSGLGLYIMRKIIEAHKNANVKIKKTVVGKGTTMQISLPIVIK